MATNVTIYVPNTGEKEMLKSILASQAVVLGLYGNLVVPDGNTIIDTLVELATGGGRGYAPKALSNDVVEGAAVADKWSIGIDTSGRGLAVYSNAPQQWTFNAADVADGATAYGVFGYTWVLPFNTGLAAGAAIKIGETITGAGGATGIVTAIVVTSGAWASGDAAGYLCIKSKTGTFVNGEALSVAGPTQVASANTGGTGDASKKLLFLAAFSDGQPISTVGFVVEFTPKFTLAST